jgi:DNA polymerase elongation subunit (family B)
MQHLAFDIETVPLKDFEEYPDAIQKKILEKIEKKKEYDPGYDYNKFASIHWDFGRIVCISCGFIHENKIKLKSFYGEDEKEILEGFNGLLTTMGPNVKFIHYNGLNFDVPWILRRMSYHGISINGADFGNLARFRDFPHLDVMMKYYNWNISNNMSLEVLSLLHNLPNPKEALGAANVYPAYKEEKWNEIVYYCEFDTATTLNLWYKIFQNKIPIPLENYIFSEMENNDS